VVAVALVVLIAAGVVVGLLLTGNGSAPITAPPFTPPASAGRSVCTEQVRISVVSDDRALQVADIVRDDEQVNAVMVETQQQSYEEFEREFQDEPTLAALGRPEALPAVVWVRPAPDVDLRALADALRRQVPDASDVQVGKPACGTPGH
jgi:hypothetical protein